MPTSVRFVDFNECNSTDYVDMVCKHNALYFLLDSNDICKSDKGMPCQAKEYKWQEYHPPVLSKGNSSFSFHVIMNSATSSIGRTSRPLKTVYNEKYAMDWLQLIGTIGGTLGMMTGFSFMGSVTSITEFVTLLLFKWRSKKQNGHVPTSSGVNKEMPTSSGVNKEGKNEEFQKPSHRKPLATPHATLLGAPHSHH